MQSVEQAQASKREGKRARSLANQVARGVAAVELALDALPLRNRLLILHEALRNVLEDMRAIERRRARYE